MRKNNSHDRLAKLKVAAALGRIKVARDARAAAIKNRNAARLIQGYHPEHITPVAFAEMSRNAVEALNAAACCMEQTAEYFERRKRN